MKVIIIGATGFIGNNIYKYARKNNISVVGTTTQASNKEFIKFDISTDDPEIILEQTRLKDRADPICAVLAGSICNINQCFQEQKYSTSVNITGTKKVLDYFHSQNIKTIFLSSDIVFDGKQGNYRETDAANPLCLYSEHKLAIEEHILVNYPEFLIYRLTKTISEELVDKNLLMDIYRQQEQSKILKCIAGNFFCPTAADDTAKYIIQGLEKNLSGLYHFASTEQISRLDFTSRVLKALESTAQAIAVDLAEFDFKEQRPLNTTLCAEKLGKVLPLQFQSINEIIKLFQANCAKQKSR